MSSNLSKTQQLTTKPPSRAGIYNSEGDIARAQSPWAAPHKTPGSFAKWTTINVTSLDYSSPLCKQAGFVSSVREECLWNLSSTTMLLLLLQRAASGRCALSFSNG